MDCEQDLLGGHVVRRELIVPQDRRVVWNAIRDAHGLSSWLADEVELEVRDGASGVLRWHSGEERFATVEEVDEERRIALRWALAGGEATLVELTLDDVPDGTRIVVLEVPLLTLHAISDATVAGASHGGPTMLATVG
ncbi:MAG: SRPBCC family protein [Solirubrobacteraceae bacterium]